MNPESDNLYEAGSGKEAPIFQDVIQNTFGPGATHEVSTNPITTGVVDNFAISTSSPRINAELAQAGRDNSASGIPSDLQHLSTSELSTLKQVHKDLSEGNLASLSQLVKTASSEASTQEDMQKKYSAQEVLKTLAKQFPETADLHLKYKESTGELGISLYDERTNKERQLVLGKDGRARSFGSGSVDQVMEAVKYFLRNQRAIL